ncbi:helix-turn-helix domain-containing protein [Limosilactobacillus reuteri]|uniref:helix-turn-helix domain-containing protein n=2 Tax=Limosilactobacillus reuteri TaxID=1598 RepID=UPI000D6ED1BB|nr:helix-turn-helix transcriptional regulator [Limosilactobacillus reuteri]MCR1893039.1 helix-turn-helix transcriptional regulator [Limosilactobacillus reuteri]PWT40858.1 hypothetical protein DKZ34_04780 [Limosilactobacillus reuteri]
MIKTNLAVLMAERGLKISDVYEATGISKTTLMAISDNTGKGIQYETMDKLCDFFNITPEQFFIYSPYNFNFHVLNNDDNVAHLNDIAITVSKSSGLKSYTFSPNVITPMGEQFNVTKEDADFIINYKLFMSIDDFDDEKLKKNKKEFYSIYDGLPTVLKSDINNKFLTLVMENLADINGQTITVLDGKIDYSNTENWTHDLTIKNNMKVIINLFDEHFTRLTKVPLLVVNSKNNK